MNMRVAIFVLFIVIFHTFDTKAEEESDHESETDHHDNTESEESDNGNPSYEVEDGEKENKEVMGDRYSFFKFRGPVSGEVREISVPSAIHPGQQTVDHVAKPDYSYTYGVHDGPSGNSHTHSESRNGDTVSGEYRVLQADGLIRIVRYSAHPSTGFTADVEYVKA